MDGFVRLFCGCCGLAGEQTTQDPPYSRLHADSVTPVRDPPLQQTTRQHTNNGSHYHGGFAGHPQQQQYHVPNEPLQEQGYINPVHDFYRALAEEEARIAQQQFSDSGSQNDLEEEVVEDEAREKEQLDSIVENTQHSIIAVGQTDVDGVIMMNTEYREAQYRQKAIKMNVSPAPGPPHEPKYDFHFDPTQTPIQVPLRYDEMSVTIDPSPIERLPFACPDFNHLRNARTMGARNPQFLTEVPDLKHAGKTPSISAPAKAKITEALDAVHAGVLAIEPEPRDLVVSMDF